MILHTLSFLPSVTFIRLRVTFEAVEPIVLPVYKGSAFRGCLGETLRNDVCCYKGRPCEKCPEQFDCPFSQLYNSFVPVQHPFQEKYPKSPHPYLIDPMPGERTNFGVGETFGFDLTLIGSAIGNLPHVVRAFYGMGITGIGQGRNRFKPVDLKVLQPDGGYGMSPTFGQPEVLSIDKLNVPESNGSITLHFENPLRLMENGKLVLRPPEFGFFIGRLAFRVGLLSHFFCGAQWPDAELKELPDLRHVKIAMSGLKEVDWQRYSGTQETTMNFDGLTGQVTYEGEGLGQWMPLLQLGTFLHTGSTATFGLGKYSILT